MDHPLLKCKDNLRLLCATISTSITPQRLEKFMMQFFDHELMDAIGKRERLYVDRMTTAFRGELERQIHDTSKHLTDARAQLTHQDKQMDFMRSQLDRRRQEIETQRRKFIHEILGMRGDKQQLTNNVLQDMLAHAFKDELGENAQTIGRRSGLDAGMGSSHLTTASQHAKHHAQKEQLTKLRDRAATLQNQLEAQQEFTDSIREQRDHWEKYAKELAKGEANKEKEISKIKLGMKFASHARLATVAKKQIWWENRVSSKAMLEKMKQDLKRNIKTPEKDASMFEGMLCLFGDSEIQDYLLPRLYQMRARQKIIEQEQKRGVYTRVVTKENNEMVTWMRNVEETAAMMLVENELERGDLFSPLPFPGQQQQQQQQPEDIPAAVTGEAGEEEEERGVTKKKTSNQGEIPRTMIVPPKMKLFCYVMDTTGSDVICPWCEGQGSVHQTKSVVSAEIETAQRAERLEIQLGNVKTALRMAAMKLQELQKKPKRRHVSLQVDNESIDKDCGGADVMHHHDEEEEQEEQKMQADDLMEQARKAMDAMKQLKISKKECAELKKKLDTNEKIFKSRGRNLNHMKEKYEECMQELQVTMEELEISKNQAQAKKIKELKELTMQERSGRGKEKEEQIQTLKNQMKILQTTITTLNSSGISKEKTKQLKGEIEARDIEIEKLKTEVEEAMKILAQQADRGGDDAWTQTQTGDDYHSSNMTNNMLRNEVDGGTEETRKSWRWLTQTKNDMEEDDDVPESEERLTTTSTTTVREALQARKWLVSKQAIMNWGLLATIMMNVMEIDEDKKYLQKQRLEWMKANKEQTEEERARTTERILNGVTNLLMGGTQPASYVPSGIFQPYIRHYATFKYRREKKSKKKRRDNNENIPNKSTSSSSVTKKRDQRVGESESDSKSKKGTAGTAGRNFYSQGVPELGSFPQRRTLFSHGCHRVTRIPISSKKNVSPSGLPADGVLHTNSSSEASGMRRKKKSSSNPHRPATARRSFYSHGHGAVRRRPKSASVTRQRGKKMEKEKNGWV